MESLVVLVIQDPQNSQEQVENIQVERDSRRNLLLDVIMPHNQLRIDKDIPRENQRSHTPIDQFNRGIPREERRHKPKQNEEPQPAEQIRHPVREVVFGLAREEGEGDEHAEREHEGLHDEPGVVEGGYDTDSVGFHDGEAREEEEVGRVAFAFPVGD